MANDRSGNPCCANFPMSLLIDNHAQTDRLNPIEMGTQPKGHVPVDAVSCGFSPTQGDERDDKVNFKLFVDLVEMRILVSPVC